MAEKEKTFTGQATAEQIADWKSKHGFVCAVEVEDSICYLKLPDRETLSAYAAMVESNPVGANEILVENCWLGGDGTILTDNAKFLGVCQPNILNHLVKASAARLKEL